MYWNKSLSTIRNLGIQISNLGQEVGYVLRTLVYKIHYKEKKNASEELSV
jgi:hypothetical protein